MDALVQFLKKPFPREESFAAAIRIIASISLFVAVFLYVFRPFGLHLIKENYLWLCAGFGAVTFVVSVFYEWLVVFVFKFKRDGAAFSFGHWILYFSIAMLLISLANFVLVRLLVIGHMDWRMFPYMLRGTFAVGLFPVIAVGAWALRLQERKYQRLAKAINEAHPERTPDGSAPAADSEPVLYDIPTDRIRYIEAMQNYIKIIHIEPSGQVSERVERSTLKSLESSGVMPEEASIVRCHRSYFVNRNMIKETRGNAQGLLLVLEDCESRAPVPVSRRYVSAFR